MFQTERNQAQFWPALRLLVYTTFLRFNRFLFGPHCVWAQRRAWLAAGVFILQPSLRLMCARLRHLKLSQFGRNSAAQSEPQCAVRSDSFAWKISCFGSARIMDLLVH